MRVPVHTGQDLIAFRITGKCLESDLARSRIFQGRGVAHGHILLAADREAAGLVSVCAGREAGAFQRPPCSIQLRVVCETTRVSANATSSVGGFASRFPRIQPGRHIGAGAPLGKRRTRGRRTAGLRLTNTSGVGGNRPAPSSVPVQHVGLANPCAHLLCCGSKPAFNSDISSLLYLVQRFRGQTSRHVLSA